ncbi:MAG: hypothetical protein V1754_07995, partial [Pseudomonadota bacterium]
MQFRKNKKIVKSAEGAVKSAEWAVKSAEGAWAAFHSPLAFAAKDGFKNVAAIKDLGCTLRRSSLKLAPYL